MVDIINCDTWNLISSCALNSFAGSTLEVSGITEVKPNGEWSITGGTAAFASAHGTIKFINSQSSTATDAIKELDIHVFHTPEPAVNKYSLTF